MSNKTKFLICCLYLILPNLATAQYCNIEFHGLEWLETAWKGKNFYFNVNGLVLTPDKRVHKVKINKKSLDKFIFSFDRDFSPTHHRTETSWTKFKPNQTYYISINPCSQYSLSAKENAQTGHIRFQTIGSKDTLKTTTSYSSEEIYLLNDSLTDYYENLMSANCYYSNTEIYFALPSYIDYEKTPDNLKKVKSRLYFHFLHGEKITATYHASSKKITISIDDYLPPK